MRKGFFLILMALFLLFPSMVFANDLDNTFSNYVVRDIKSGRVFSEKASNIKKLTASTTKIMTAIVAIENSNLSDVALVGEEILTMDGANVYLEIGERILLQDLLYGMILRSGNDAAMTIAKHVSGSVDNFVVLMNEKARELGLRNTIFNNPTGLDDFEKNYSTANELSIIYSYAYKNEQFRDIVGTSQYKASSDKKSYLFNNRMKILKLYDKATGGKTGYTPAAGRLLISSASNNDLDLVIVSIGNDYGYNAHVNAFEDIFKEYKDYEILDKDKFKVKSTLEGNLYIKNSFSYPLKKDEIDLVKKKMIFNNKKKGVVGEVLVYLGDEIIHKENIYLRVTSVSWLDRVKEFFGL